MTPEEIAAKRRDIIKRIRDEWNLRNKPSIQSMKQRNPDRQYAPEEGDERYPDHYFKRYRLAQIIRDTGARGIRWFDKGEITLARDNTDADHVGAYSFHPALPWQPGSPNVSWCALRRSAVRFIEPENTDASQPTTV